MARNEDRDDRGAADRDLRRQDTDGDDAALRARLAKLSGALDKQRQMPFESDDGESADSSGESLGAATNLGFRALVEFVTAVVVGPLIGWQIDTWLSTGPIFLIIFLIIGMVAGLVNVYRIAVGSSGHTHGSK